VPGIEVIIGDTVSYEQGRKPRIVPNRIRGAGRATQACMI
jgi:hypothetical protein